ncbi:MAG: sigma-70 family RNA polymerase sigma factor [Pseudomonadota bacterium]
MQEQRKDGAAAARSTAGEANEVRLIGLIAGGDRLAFSELYRAYFPRLVRFLDRMTRSAPLIEEVVNDTMLVVWQRAARFNHTSKVSTWIFAIAYRTALKGIAGLDEPLEADADAGPGAAHYEPEAALGWLQLQQDVARALDALPAPQRTVVNLAYYHGMAYEEIAVVMDCPTNTVKTRMFNARLRLKQLLAAQLE